jgi:hypothetical protein
VRFFLAPFPFGERDKESLQKKILDRGKKRKKLS